MTDQEYGDHLLRQWAAWVRSENILLFDTRNILWRMMQRRMENMPGTPSLEFQDDFFMKLDKWIAILPVWQKRTVKLRYLSSDVDDSKWKRLGVSRGTYYRWLAQVQRNVAYDFTA